MAPREHIIAVRILDDEVVSASHVINRGDTVIWRFNEDVKDATGQRLEVRLKGGANGPFVGAPLPAPGQNDQIVGLISTTSQESSIGFDIFKDGRQLEWADGRNGGCMKPIEPPRRPGN